MPSRARGGEIDLFTILPFPLARAVETNIEQTRQFQRTLKEVLALANANQQQPIILRQRRERTALTEDRIDFGLSQILRSLNPIAVRFTPERESRCQRTGIR